MALLLVMLAITAIADRLGRPAGTVARRSGRANVGTEPGATEPETAGTPPFAGSLVEPADIVVDGDVPELQNSFKIFECIEMPRTLGQLLAIARTREQSNQWLSAY